MNLAKQFGPGVPQAIIRKATTMPRYVIERQYLLPVYEQLLIDAPNLVAACREALDEYLHPWSDDAKEDFDTAGPVIVTRAVKFPELPRGFAEYEDPNQIPLGNLLYNSDLDPLPIPSEFAGDT
jgi:hypothetical protein